METRSSTALTRVSNKPLSEQSLSEMGVTPGGKLSPDRWRALNKGFLYFAAIADYATEMCKAMADRAREIAEEADRQASEEPVNETDTK